LRHPVLSRRAIAVLIVAQLVLTATLTWFGTSFRPVDHILSQSTFGAGRPSSTYITAFATLRPWWNRWIPEAVRLTAEGGIEPVVRVPRSAVRSAGERVLPSRSPGYGAFLGVVTALRSLFSANVVFDFRLFVLVQRALLVVALSFAPLALYLTHPTFRHVGTLFAYNIAYAMVLLVWPHRNVYLTEGLIDSALANAFAILGVFAFFVTLRGFDGPPRRKVAIGLAGLFLSGCTMIRAEFLLVYGFVIVFFLALRWTDRSRRKALVAILCLLPLFPVANGLVNQAVFGHFVPFRMQSGQNLFEPIGQYPNPYGIRYDDAWLGDYLAQRGMEYLSFEADRYLTRRYVEILVDDPVLFATNLYRRLRTFSHQFGVLLNAWTLPVVLALIGFLAYRDDGFLIVSVPLIVAVGYLLVFGWLNSLFRLVTPVHFLVDLFLCFVVVRLAQAMWHRKPANGGLTR
jgi:hypothetical protein